jgi:hypothetical protein
MKNICNYFSRKKKEIEMRKKMDIIYIYIYILLEREGGGGGQRGWMCETVHCQLTIFAPF